MDESKGKLSLVPLGMCTYMLTDCTNRARIEGCYKKGKEDVLIFKEKGRVVFLGDLGLVCSNG